VKVKVKNIQNIRIPQKKNFVVKLYLVVKPTLPANFKLVEDIHVDILSNAEEAVQQSAMF